jgi:hypothetical protein
MSPRPSSSSDRSPSPGSSGDSAHSREHTNWGTTEQHPNSLRVGLVAEYGVPHLQSYVRDLGLPAPMNRMVPLVEIERQTFLDRRSGGKTIGTANVGGGVGRLGCADRCRGRLPDKRPYGQRLRYTSVPTNRSRRTLWGTLRSPDFRCFAVARRRGVTSSVGPPIHRHLGAPGIGRAASTTQLVPAVQGTVSFALRMASRAAAWARRAASRSLARLPRSREQNGEIPDVRRALRHYRLAVQVFTGFMTS